MMPIVPIEPHEDQAERCPLVPSQNPVAEPTDYEVGYGKPPKHSRFRKGQSGNPRGRPKFAKSLNTIVREEMLAKVAVRTSRGERHVPRIQALFLKLLEAGGKGDLRALRMLLDLYATVIPDAPTANEVGDTFDFTQADRRVLELLKERLSGGAK